MVLVTFTSTTFSLNPLPDAINNVLGHDLAAWLAAGLLARGFDADTVIGEDYGYGFHLRLERAYYWITASQVEPEAEDAAPQWRVGIDADPGCLGMWRLRARPAPDDKRKIARAIHALLLTDPSITGIEWWTRDGQHGTPTPEL